MIRVGKIAAVHGLRGAVVLTHIAAGDWLRKGDTLFLELRKESYIPYFVSEVNSVKEGEYLVVLEDVATAEEARKLVGKQVYVRENILQGHTGDTPLLWIGFNVVDRKEGPLGPLEDVMQAGTQWLGRITREGREVLIPLVEPVLVEVNLKNRFIRTALPEGLLEIYTE
jgi:16S rRNA processing protein RimM